MGGLIGLLPRPRIGGRTRTRAAVAALTLTFLWAPTPAEGASIRAAYFYDYMDLHHLDTLASAGFNRAIVRIIGDSLGSGPETPLRDWFRRGSDLGVEVVPDWLVQSQSRLEALHTRRRYVWGPGNREPNIACPLDSAYWRSALLDRAEEMIAALPGAKRLAIDLEIHSGSRKYYDAGPCRCEACLDEYTRGRGAEFGGRGARSDLMSYQELRLTRILTALLRTFAARHPGVEIGVLDLDRDTFVHGSPARALARSNVPTASYSERSYAKGGVTLRDARKRLDTLGLPNAPLVGGLWLKRFPPRQVPAALRSVIDRADGYFVFTTYSLWREPSRLTGPYTLLGSPAEYWRALREVNRTP